MANTACHIILNCCALALMQLASQPDLLDRDCIHCDVLSKLKCSYAELSEKSFTAMVPRMCTFQLWTKRMGFHLLSGP